MAVIVDFNQSLLRPFLLIANKKRKVVGDFFVLWSLSDCK